MAVTAERGFRLCLKQSAGSLTRDQLRPAFGESAA